MILDKIDKPQDLKIIDRKQLKSVSQEIRELIINTTSDNGGHLAPSLGVVELTIALHYVLDLPKDRIIWDVGHQAYAHKILTGRRKKFKELRKEGGISGFPKRSESKCDPFGAGHSSTSISAALGIAAARDINKEDFKVVAVIGDGSLTGGLAFEGLNNAGHLKSDMLVILNDNDMFISKKVGAMAEYLTRILTFEPIYKIESKLKDILNKHPKWGEEMIRIARRSKTILTPGMLFEELGFDYYGPVDGHNVDGLIDTINKIKDKKGPKLLHVLTKKGKGYEPAEQNPEYFHGAGPFEISSGKPVKIKNKLPKYQDVFGKTIVELAEKDKSIVAITAAMSSGTGLTAFAEKFPDRFFDVGIAEQHALTFAAGLATEAIKPVCAIYSTFLQRAYDQIIHDIALQDLPVILAIDRAGIVGEDGPTHHGAFDLTYLSSVPGLVVAAPSSGQELRNLLYSAMDWACPVAIRYPRGAVSSFENMTDDFTKIKIGSSRVLEKGKDLYILAVGSAVEASLAARDILNKNGIDAGVVDMRFAKPVDRDTVIKCAKETGKIVTVEENILTGGFGYTINHLVSALAEVECIALPDEFISFGSLSSLRKKYGLDAGGIAKRITGFLSD